MIGGVIFPGRGYSLMMSLFPPPGGEFRFSGPG